MEKQKTYIFKRAYPNKLGKEIGDYYNGEFGDTASDIERLIAKGIIEEEAQP